jgi:MurNAc alpha-1-phosphate uridylyltransferase
MRAMILAAGRGERMCELTAATPKPLIKVGGRYLIEYSLRALAEAGIREIVINVCYLRDQIKETLGNGECYGVAIEYSDEDEALETGGGIVKALPLLGSDPFLVMSSDIISDFPLRSVLHQPKHLAHLVVVDNPPFHPQGDFCLYEQLLYYGKGHTYTFGNIGVYRPEMFQGMTVKRFRLGELLKTEILNQQVSGEHFEGFWHNVGTPEQLILADNFPDVLNSLI